MVDLQHDDLKNLLKQGDIDIVCQELINMEAADIADLLEDIGAKSDHVQQIFSRLAPDLAAEVISELEGSTFDELFSNKKPKEMAIILSNMAPDDATDLIEEMELSEEELKELLTNLSQESRVEIIKLLGYEEDSGGSIMTPELCSLPANATVIEALAAISKADLSDPIMAIYVVEPSTSVLLGYINLTDLLSQSKICQTTKSFDYTNKTKLGELVDDNYIFASTDDDQEEIAQKFRKYNLWVMPVVDSKHRLVGRITADDIMDVIQEEADEDIAKMIGAPDFEEPEESAFKAVKLRLPWLLITMLAGLINSFLIQSMQAQTVATAAIFIPVLMGMGGNTSIQATAIAVREITIGRLSPSHLWRTIGKQMLIGGLMGIVASSIVWFGSYGVLLICNNDSTLVISRLSTAIAIAMFFGMIFASAFGSLVPVLLNKIHIDPAVASGPFVTTSNDISAATIYFLSCLILLN